MGSRLKVCAHFYLARQSAQRTRNPEMTKVSVSVRQLSLVRSFGSCILNRTGGYAMMRDFQLAKGDICGDSTGLRVRIEDVDIYDYVHFSVVERSDSGEDEAESRQMSHGALVDGFCKLIIIRPFV